MEQAEIQAALVTPLKELAEAAQRQLDDAMRQRVAASMAEKPNLDDPVCGEATEKRKRLAAIQAKGAVCKREQPTPDKGIVEKKRPSRARRGRGEGSIYERDGQWVGVVSRGYDGKGKRKRRVVYAATKAQVQEKLRRLQDQDSPAELERLSMETYLRRWLDLVQPTVEHSTYVSYKQHVEGHIIPLLGTLKLAKLKRFHVEEMYASLAKKGVSPSMQRKLGTTLTIALGAALDKDMIAFNPASRVRKPKAVKADIQPLDAEQVSTFLKTAKEDRLYAFYVTALDTGMRPGECRTCLRISKWRLVWARHSQAGDWRTSEIMLSYISAAHTFRTELQECARAAAARRRLPTGILYVSRAVPIRRRNTCLASCLLSSFLRFCTRLIYS